MDEEYVWSNFFDMVNIHSWRAFNNRYSSFGKHFWFGSHLFHHLLKVSLILVNFLHFLHGFLVCEISCHFNSIFSVLCSLKFLKFFLISSLCHLSVLVKFSFHFQLFPCFCSVLQLHIFFLIKSCNIPCQSSSFMVCKLVRAGKFVLHDTNDMVFPGSHCKCSMFLVFVQVW